MGEDEASREGGCKGVSGSMKSLYGVTKVGVRHEESMYAQQHLFLLIFERSFFSYSYF